MEVVVLTVKTERTGPIKCGHPWVFSGALTDIPDGIQSGTPVILQDTQGTYLATGYFNSYSQIAVRIMCRNKETVIGKEYFKTALENAVNLRKQLIDQSLTNGYRIVNSENDFIPGLIIDKYDDYLSIQFHTAGIAAWRDTIIDAVVEVCKPEGIFERSEIRAREREGGGENCLLYGSVPDQILIKENGYSFLVDIKEGQKTGFYLDQREKRKALQKYVPGKTVLNCFSYSGGFSVYALGGGASHVTSVDISQKAIDLAKENIKLNGLSMDSCTFEHMDVKKFLSTETSLWDVVILDPPAFIKSRKKIKPGIVGYKTINVNGMKRTKPEGILLSCSCSAHLSMLDFRHLITESMGRAGRNCQLLESFTHGLDHPVLTAFMESEYLKSLYLRVI